MSSMTQPPLDREHQNQPLHKSRGATLLSLGSPVAGLLLQHTKHALRQLVRYPAFSIVAVLSMVIGIGATTAVFTVFNVALLQPLSAPEPHRLVLLSPERRGEGYVFFNPVYESLRDEQRTLSGMSAISAAAVLEGAVRG